MNKKVNFDKALSQGQKSYDFLQHWWEKKSSDYSHQKAYYNIVQYTKSLWKQSSYPKIIVDFACGEGSLLFHLAKAFPKSKLVGFDGSKKLLGTAQKKLEKAGLSSLLVTQKKAFQFTKSCSIHLVKTALPNFSLPKFKADLVFFTFPNMTSGNREYYYNQHGFLNRKDVNVAEMLARFREMDPEDEIETISYDDCYDELMTNKILFRNLRHLCKKNALLIKTEYANAVREELTELDQMRQLFGEGALTKPVKESYSIALFEYQTNIYKRSTVISDVFDQTQNQSDKSGGYLISHFKAI